MIPPRAHARHSPFHAMTDQHRATPEQWEHVEICAGMKQIPWATAACLLELRARVEQLETALLSLTSTVAKAGNDHKSRIEALELGQRVTDAYIVTAATLSPEERKELGVVTVPEFKAAMARTARQGAENAMAQIRTGAPVVKEFDKEFEPPANCRQRLQRNGMPYPKSGCDACGNMSPKWQQCDAALARSATIEPPPIASDQDLIKAWHSVPGEGFIAALRAVYSLGRQHGSDAKQGAPDPAMDELRAASADLNSSAGLTSSPGGLVESALTSQGVFKGQQGLQGLLDADEFWFKQPYGTRLYYGDGGLDYLHRDVLRAAVRHIQETSRG